MLRTWGCATIPVIFLKVFLVNLANRKSSAIDYYYTSRLPGEPAAGIADAHFHPVESRSFRLSLQTNF